MKNSSAPTSSTDNRIIHAAFDKMTHEEQCSYFNENGFVVIPGAIDASSVQRIFDDIYAQNWSCRYEKLWSSHPAWSLVENEKVVSAVRALYGPDIRCFKGVYVRQDSKTSDENEPRRQSLHIDYGTGEGPEDFRNFYPSWVNVGFYLTNLTPEHGPLWVVPRSNHCYLNGPGTSLEQYEPEAKMVLAKAGDAVLFHCTTIHAGGYNFSHHSREGIFLSYRPSWTQSIGPVLPWTEEALGGASKERKQLLAS